MKVPHNAAKLFLGLIKKFLSYKRLMAIVHNDSLIQVSSQLLVSTNPRPHSFSIHEGAYILIISGNPANSGRTPVVIVPIRVFAACACFES